MKLRFTPRAVQDLADIAGFVREQNPPAALRVRAAILESLQNLVLFPHVGRQQKVEHVRKLVTRRYRYLVYYTADEQSEEIVILTISTPLVIASMRTLSPTVAFGPRLDEPHLSAFAHQPRNCGLRALASEGWCGRPESNRHSDCSPRDFKSLASTNSATPAFLYESIT